MRDLEEQSKVKEESFEADVADKKRIAGMSDDLGPQTSAKFDRNTLDIDIVDSNLGTLEIVSDTKSAIEMALHEQDPEAIRD